MIYTPLTKKALNIAYDAHEGQLDKSGLPYIFHPYHLAEQMDDEDATCVALLHDVIEDTDVTLEKLTRDFPPRIVDAVQLLTHDPSVRYPDYIRAIKNNPLATKVKLADIAHNSDETRFTGCADISSESLERRRKKYSEARAILES